MLGVQAFAVAFLALIFNEVRIMPVKFVLLGIGIGFAGQSTTTMKGCSLVVPL